MLPSSMQQQTKPSNATFEERITKIKEICVATFILEMTRSLKPDEKQAVKSYCDKVLFRAQQQKSGGPGPGGMPSQMNIDDDENLPNLADLHQRIDQMKISSLSNLKFDESGKRILQQLYDDISLNSFYGFSFSNFYQKVLDGVISQVKEEQKKQANQSSSAAKPNQKMGFANLRVQPGYNEDVMRIEQNNLFSNWIDADNPREFFKMVIKCFEHVNFYNLLIL